MDSANYESQIRIFKDVRLHPWIPEHKIFIDAELAKMAVLEPKDEQRLRAQYDEKMQRFNDQNADPVKSLQIKEEVVVAAEEEVKEIVKKKPGRKFSHK